MNLADKNFGDQRSLAEYQAFHGQMAASWEAMGEGGPTLAALAALGARTLISPDPLVHEAAIERLSLQAMAILYSARERGIIEVRGVKTAFETPGRLLAIYVEESEHRTVAFRSRENPEITVQFFDGFCELCRTGLILHHLHRDFTLSRRGFEVARSIDRREIEDQLAAATEFGLHDR
ncbi:MAG: hypothetical protein ACO1RT_17560 [Planctomycetaceae bacterium]